MEAIPVIGINHISLVVRDVEVTKRFYRDLLGFTEIWRPNFPFEGAWLFAGNMVLHLIKGTPPEPSPKIDSRFDHVAFHVNDCDVAEACLKEYGVEYLRKAQSSTGLTQIFFHDPDGHQIELGTYPITRITK